jgi:hypothetical protein
MNSRPLAALCLSFVLTGCATFNDTELGIIRQSGVSPRVFEKMRDERVLTPEDVIEATRRRVPERYLVRQIEDAGVDYVLSPDDYRRLQRAGVSPLVLETLVAASDEFASLYVAPRYDMYPVDPYYDDYYGPGLHPRVSGSVGAGFTTGGRGRWRHW